MSSLAHGEDDVTQHTEINHTHLSLRCSDSCPARVNLLIDGGEEVLRYPQSILQEGEVWVILGSVF